MEAAVNVLNLKANDPRTEYTTLNGFDGIYNNKELKPLTTVIRSR